MLRRLVPLASRGASAAPFSTAAPGAEAAQEKKPTIWKIDEKKRDKLANFGRYAAQCLPKFVQQVQFAAGDELELLIHPSGVIPVLSFLLQFDRSLSWNIEVSNSADRLF